MDIRDSQRIKQICDNTEKMADAFTRIADALERLAEPKTMYYPQVDGITPSVIKPQCEECGHWEHGAGDHYYCALLEMGQECYFESKDESTLMFANEPQTEPTRSKMEQVDKDTNVRSKDCETCKYNEEMWYTTICDGCCRGNSHYEPKDEPQEREGE